jgi:DNA-binding transcriptional LysR family regulator
MMDLTMLRQFAVVARLEHLSRAADELHVAQPSLSRTIARLENELGTPLFDRAARLRLNPAGALFRGYVERALGELDAGRRGGGGGGPPGGGGRGPPPPPPRAPACFRCQWKRRPGAASSKRLGEAGTVWMLRNLP